MEAKEKIPVWVRYYHGKTVCICPRNKKKCKKHCSAEIVERDKFRNWQKCFAQDKFGKSQIP